MDQISIVKKILEVIMSIFRKVNFHQLLRKGDCCLLQDEPIFFCFVSSSICILSGCMRLKNMGE